MHAPDTYMVMCKLQTGTDVFMYIMKQKLKGGA